MREAHRSLRISEAQRQRWVELDGPRRARTLGLLRGVPAALPPVPRRRLDLRAARLAGRRRVGPARVRRVARRRAAGPATRWWRRGDPVGRQRLADAGGPGQRARRDAPLGRPHHRHRRSCCWRSWRHRAPQHLRLDRREAVAFASFGVLGLVAVQWLYTFAVARMDVALVLVIEYLAPLLVVVWAVAVMREHVPRAGLAADGRRAGRAGAGARRRRRRAGHGLRASARSRRSAAPVTYAYYVLHAERLMRVRPAVAVVALGMGFGAVFWAVAAPWWSFPTDALGRRGRRSAAASTPRSRPGWR